MEENGGCGGCGRELVVDVREIVFACVSVCVCVFVCVYVCVCMSVCVCVCSGLVVLAGVN